MRLKAKGRTNLLLKLVMMWWWNPQQRKVWPQIAPLVVPTVQKYGLRSRLMQMALKLHPLKVTSP